jgi:adenine C2-methylase RlmN of 23S rRNA A2503 and tRNA A37
MGIAEIYKNKDNSVIKYVHHNGAETTVKFTNSCNFKFDDNISLENPIEIDRNKVVVFLSISVGCRQRCKFCYLTLKNFPYHKLTDEEIIKNTIYAIESSGDLSDKYIKLSFMGMGDVLDSSSNDIFKITTEILIHCLQYDLIKGIDGIDIGTVFPKNTVDLISLKNSITLLNNWIRHGNLPLNPAQEYNIDYPYHSTHEKRTPVRLFISLHATSDDVRSFLMPNSDSISRIMVNVYEFDIDVIFHYILLSDINDSKFQIRLLADIFSKGILKDFELRVLRYNKCNGSIFNESHRFEEIIKYLSLQNIKFKYQISTGSEIKAACGQFICHNTVGNDL